MSIRRCLPVANKSYETVMILSKKLGDEEIQKQIESSNP
jgi:hypothetical protein